MLATGTHAPDFLLNDKDGNPVSIKDFAGKPVVLYFFAKDRASSGTRQACAFAAAYDEFQALGVRVIGISRDSEKKHRKFSSKYNLPFLLLSDPESIAMQAYDVWQGDAFCGAACASVPRTAYIISADGRIEQVLEQSNPDTIALETLSYFRRGHL